MLRGHAAGGGQQGGAGGWRDVVMPGQAVAAADRPERAIAAAGQWDQAAGGRFGDGRPDGQGRDEAER